MRPKLLCLHWACAAWVVLGCNDAKTVDPQVAEATLDPPGATDHARAEARTPETSMSKDPQPQIHPLGIDDAAFFEGDVGRAMAAARKELRKAGVPALRIDAPFEVDTASHSSLPVHGVFARTAEQHGDLAQSSIIVAVDLTHGGFHAAPALRSGKLSGKGGGSKAGAKGGDPAAAFVASSFDLDVLQRLPELARTGAQYRLYVVQQGLRSNGARSALSGEATRTKPTLPTQLVANLQAHADSPGAPAGGGVSLSTPAQAVSEPGGSAMLRGAVRADGDSTRVFLLATSDKASGPFSFFVDVPLHDGLGHFNVDVIADEGPPKRPALWHWHAFVGEESAGPAQLKLDPGKPW